MDLVVGFIVYFYRALLILGIVFGFIYYKKLDAVRKSLVVYLIFMSVTESASEVLREQFGYNHVVLPLYCLFEVAFFTYFFNRLSKSKEKFSPVTLIGLAGGLYIVCELYYNFIYQFVSAVEYQPYVKVVDNFCVIIFCLIYLYRKISNYAEKAMGNFSLSIGILVNFTLSTIFYLPFNFLVNVPGEVKFYFWICNAILIGIFYAFLTYHIVTFALNKKPQTSLK